MKIVMFCDFYDPSLLYQENLVAEQYVKLGHEVTVIASTFISIFDFMADRYNPASPARTEHAKGVKIVRLPYRINFLSRVRFFGGVDSLLKSEAPELIFVHDIMFNLVNAVRYVRRHPHVRMILDYHADYSNSGKNWLSRRVLHGMLRRAVLSLARPHLQRIFPVTPASAKFLHELYGVPHREMELLPLGTDMALVADVQQSGADRSPRLLYGIGENDFVIFTGGKLTPGKRTELLIEAFKQLDKPDSWLVIAGDSAAGEAEYKASLMAAAQGCPRIVFTGWLDTRPLFEHIGIADIAVFPSSQSVVWQHAIGMGKPVIIGDPAARKDGRQDFSYLNTYNNVLIRENEGTSARWILDAIRQLADDPGRRTLMAEGARRVADELLDWNRTIRRTLRFNAAGQ